MNDIIMKPKEQRRALVLARLLDGRYTAAEGAQALELSAAAAPAPEAAIGMGRPEGGCPR
ncbi:MAG: hypothetical protein M3P30_15140 [Chloroflexota bacterium]|nr:hypothetical protein [Chloroflexota bacterium]